MNLTYGSVCSGIEAVSVGWHGLGFAEPAWFSEIDKAASNVLACRFPHVSNIGDMLEIPFQIKHGIVTAPDILVGGTPCQSFSIAGRREGMGDTRGQLTLTYVEIANAIDRVRADVGQQPCITVWENVPGCLSDKDNAFGCFIAALAGDEIPFEPGERPATGKSSQYWTWGKKRQCHNAKWPVAGLVVGPQRTVAWIVRDAQYFGLAQRRRRVFVVASARQGFDPGAILFEPDCVRRDSPPSRKQGQDVAGTLDARTDGGGFPGTDGACSGHVVPARRPDANAGVPAVAFTQNSRDEVRLINEDGAIAGAIAGALSAESGSHQTNYLATNMAVRRLMPVETERLQGFPDGFTRIPISHHAERKVTTSRAENRWEPDPNGGWWLMSADGPRYKQIGNSMATPVMRWLGTRIRDYLKLQPYLELIG